MPSTLPVAQQSAADAGFVTWDWNLDNDRFACLGDAALLGTLPEDAEGLIACVHADAQPAFSRALRHTRENGTPFALECAGEKAAWLAIRGRIANSGDGARHLIGVMLDFAARKTTELSEGRRVIALQRELDLERADFDAFAYAVSHDLRAPLRAIGGFSEVLLESEPGSLEASARQYLPRIVTATARMSQLLDDLLQLSRFNRAELHPEPLDLAEMVRAIAAELNDVLTGRKVELVAPQSAPAWGDRNLLHAVLQRLLDNAWKFTRYIDAPRVEFGRMNYAHDNERDKAFYVRDNGVGFDAQGSDRLFQPLQRLHRASDFEGSGVGLTIVKRIIERHGGSVWAEGAPGAGACFWFRLPAAPAADM